ncbi:hypothetical protein AB0M02_22405 [Actinoplanes sp. NPDC051861]|uniref:hypothetical protein n=1 Tax=Actinoplanes sp. NPDC051861 TaxID=3155170 RepID=UPI00344844A8
MSHADLTLAAWRTLSDETAHQVAAAIARDTGSELVDGFFERDGRRFALVPGGAARVGYDAARFSPTERQAAHFAAEAAEWGIEESLHDFVDQATSPARAVVLPALLVAVRSEPAGNLVLDDDGDGDDHAWMTAGLAGRGLRPPTPDEWEFACGAGATTLFHWGDDYPDGEPYGDVPLLAQPNRFGLHIADDPYRAEFTTDPQVLCGGDGGSAVCGGYGSFLSWLTLATAYRDTSLPEVVADGGLTDETPVRPVIAIP